MKKYLVLSVVNDTGMAAPLGIFSSASEAYAATKLHECKHPGMSYDMYEFSEGLTIDRDSVVVKRNFTNHKGEGDCGKAHL